MTTDTLQTFKTSVLRSTSFTHLNNAGIAPLCAPARQALHDWANRGANEGSFSIPDLMATQEKTRASLARLLNAKPENIAFFQGAANAISQVAFGLEFGPGDEVLTWDQEYPSNFYPWRDAVESAGGRLVVAKSGPHFSTPIDSLFSQVTPRTRVIAVSLVQYQSGALTNLEELASMAQERGIFTFADVIQGIGALPFDFSASGIDAVVGGSHKWLLSPIGVGYLCAKTEVIERLKPQAVGAMTYGTSEDLATLAARPKTGPSRLEPGSRPLYEIAAFGASLELFLNTGMDRISQEAEWLAKKLLHGLRERGYEIQTPNGPHHRGPIVNFKPGRGAALESTGELANALKDAQIAFAPRAGGIRLSPHAYTLMDDLEKVWEVVSQPRRP